MLSRTRLLLLFAMKKTLALILLLAWLTVGARAATLTWNGSWNDMTWNTENGNWLLNGAHAVYANGNDVVFGDTGNGYVSLSGELAPSSVLVKSDNYYFFCSDIGEGNKLTGTMQLTKEGEGKLTIQTANDYTGGTIIKGGTLQMGNENALGSDDVTLMGGTLNLGGCTLSNNVNVNGTAHITNGTVSGNLILADYATFTLSNATNLQLTGSISLGTDAELDLGKRAISNDIILNGSYACIGNGSINKDLYVKVGLTLVLKGDIDGPGNIIIGSDATLELRDIDISNSVILNEYAQISGSGTISGDLILADNVSFSRNGSSPYDGVQLTGGVTLGNNARFDLNGQTLSASVNVIGDNAIIRRGSLSGDLILADNVSFTWHGSSYDDDVQLTGSVTLGNDAWFALNGQTLSASVNVIGDNATIQGGNLAGDLTIGAGKMSFLFGDITGTGVIFLEDRAQLHWTGQTFSGSIKLGKRSAIDADFVSSNTTIKTRADADGAVLEKVSVSDGHIAGTDRQASLADGLKIQSDADLMIESMTITANNEIHVGDNTITLKDVTIKLSQAHYDETEGVFLFDLGTLINCDLVMQNVLLDASDLTLPEGFDPATTSVVFDFGDDVTITQATGLDMRLGNYWSPSLNLDQQGQVIFTKLVPTPEPTTGTLVLLALAALAARRRKK